MSNLQQDIEQWIYKWVSVYNPALEAVPCPFAKQAYVDNRIFIEEIKPVGGYSLDEIIYGVLDQVTQNWPEDKEVLVLGCDPALIDCAVFEDTVAECNAHTLIPRGYIALEDHPGSQEIVAGETMNQGTWALVLVQAKSKLDKASAQLERQGYYKNWSEENLNDVVRWRKTS
jgi:hypothetical protein